MRLTNLTAAYLFADGHVICLREHTVKLAGKRTTTLEYAELFEHWTKARLRFEGRIVLHRHHAAAFLKLAKLATEIRATEPALSNGSDNTRNRGLRYGSLSFELDGDVVDIPIFSDGTDLGGYHSSICSNGYTYQPRNVETWAESTENGTATHWCSHTIWEMHPLAPFDSVAA